MSMTMPPDSRGSRRALRPRGRGVAVLAALPLLLLSAGPAGAGDAAAVVGERPHAAPAQVAAPDDLAHAPDDPADEPDDQQLLAAAREKAAELGQLTDVDPFVEALAEAPRKPPAIPVGDDVDACLDSDDAHSADGRVYNRFMWCQRWHISAGYGVTGPLPGGKLATVDLEYSAVAYGRDDGRRGVTVFFRGDDATYEPARFGYIRPTSLLKQRIVCDALAGCDDTGYTEKPIKDWMSQWTRFDIASDASRGNGPDNVAVHTWQFQGEINTEFNQRLELELPSAAHTLRCDSATYFGPSRTGACVLDDVIPRLQYNVNDPRVAEVAEHIRCAQAEPFCLIDGERVLTWPPSDFGKLIPGKYVPKPPGEVSDLEGLHRIRTGKVSPDRAYTENVAEKNWACRNAPTDVYDPAAGEECDEYPFASVAEGASNIDYDYSVVGVPKEVNKCAGIALQDYYRIDRVLRSYRDPGSQLMTHVDGFFVHINDAPAPPVSGPCEDVPPDEGDDGGGGPPPVNLAPSVSIDGDVAGDEGAPVRLGASAADPEGEELTLAWQATPGPDVDPGATCSFSSTVDLAPTVTCTDDGTFTLTLTARDAVNAASDSATLTLTNVAPGLDGSPTAPVASAAQDPDPVPEVPGIAQPQPWQVFRAGTEVGLVARFTEPGANDTHTCRTVWDDGTTTSYAPTDLTCRTSHVFEHPGMYTIETEVTDDDAGSGTAEVMVIVYDPDAGFATGGGLADEGSAGKAHFQFNSRYHPHDEGPEPTIGKVDYRIDGRSLDVDSTNLEWLVVTPDDLVAVKGTGTLDGEAGYGFVLYADSREPDRLRVVVWPSRSGAYPTDTIVHDTVPGGDFDLDRSNPPPIRHGSVHVAR